MAIKAGELCFPKAAIGFEPFSDSGEWRGDEPARTALGIASACNQPRVLQYLQVLGDGGLTETGWFHQLRNIRCAGRQARQNRPAGGICEGGKGGAEPIPGYLHRHIAI